MQREYPRNTAKHDTPKVTLGLAGNSFSLSLTHCCFNTSWQTGFIKSASVFRDAKQKADQAILGCDLGRCNTYSVSKTHQRIHPPENSGPLQASFWSGQSWILGRETGQRHQRGVGRRTRRWCVQNPPFGGVSLVKSSSPCLFFHTPPPRRSLTEPSIWAIGF